MKDKPNWKKGDIVSLLNNYGGTLSIFVAEHDPQYCSTPWSSEGWHYGLRRCEEIRLATIYDIDREMKFRKENLEREQSRLDELLNFREILEHNNYGS